MSEPEKGLAKEALNTKSQACQKIDNTSETSITIEKLFSEEEKSGFIGTKCVLTVIC